MARKEPEQNTDLYYQQLFAEMKSSPPLTDPRITDQERELADSLFAKLEEGGMLAEDIEKVKQAANLLSLSLSGLKRKSGDEASATHSYHVAHILADTGFVRNGQHRDWEMITSALLHDVPEDTNEKDYPKPPIILKHIEDYFGENVSTIIDALTKVKGKKQPEPDALTYLKILESLYKEETLSREKDPRPILIKLADRLHNMRTLRFLPLEDQVRKARETLDVYVPMAIQNGLSQWADELATRAIRVIYNADESKKHLLAAYSEYTAVLYPKGEGQKLELLRQSLLQSLRTVEPKPEDGSHKTKQGRVLDISVQPPSAYEFYLNTRNGASFPYPPGTITIYISESRPARISIDPRYEVASRTCTTLKSHFGACDLDDNEMIERSIARGAPINLPFRLYDDGTRFRVRFVTEEEKKQADASLIDYFFDDGNPLNPYAKEKVARLGQNLKTITEATRRRPDMPRQIVEDFLRRPEIPLITVSIIRRGKRKPVVIPVGSSILDAVVVHNSSIAHRFRPDTLIVIDEEGQQITDADLNSPIQEQHRISFKYEPTQSNRIRLDPLWLDAVHTPYAQRILQSKFLEIIREEIQEPDSERKYLREIRKRGKSILNKLFQENYHGSKIRVSPGQLDEVTRLIEENIHSPLLQLPEDPYSSMLILLALNMLDVDDEANQYFLSRVLNTIYDYQSRLIPVRFTVSDEIGMEARIAAVLAQHGIDIKALDHDPDTTTPKHAELTYWFEPGEETANLEKAQKAAAILIQDGSIHNVEMHDDLEISLG